MRHPWDEGAFKQALDLRDKNIIDTLVTKLKESQKNVASTAIEQMIADAGFKAAVEEVNKESFAQFDQSLPENIRTILAAERQKEAQKVGESGTIITLQSLEDNWQEFMKDGTNELQYAQVDVPIAKFFQDIDSASGVSATRRGNLNAIFGMMASNPFSPWVTTNPSNGMGEIKLGVFSGFDFVSDQIAGGKKPAPESATNRAVGDVVNTTVGGVAEESVNIHRYYCNFLISNPALEQIQGARGAITRGITRAWVKAAGKVIANALDAAKGGVGDTDIREVVTGVAAKVPTPANFPGKVAEMMAAPFADSMIPGDVAWIVRPELWKSLIPSDIQEGYDPAMFVTMLFGFPWLPTSQLEAEAANKLIAYFGNYREAITFAMGPNMRIEANRTTRPGYTYFHAEGSMGVNVHNTSNTLVRMKVAAS